MATPRSKRDGSKLVAGFARIWDALALLNFWKFSYEVTSHCLLVVLQTAVFVLTGFSACGRADDIRILGDDREAFQARADLVREARWQIDAAYLAVTDDDLALAFLATLRDAARRGVRVRLLVDGMFNDIPLSVQADLAESSIAIREFHPVELRRPLALNRRMHDKLLIVDACHLLIGSRNIDHRHFGLGCVNFVDRDAYVRGAVAQQAGSYFECLWSSAEPAAAKTSYREKSEQRDCHPVWSLSRQLEACHVSPKAALDQALFQASESGLIGIPYGQDWRAGGRECRCAEFLYDCVGGKREPCAITGRIHELLASARKSIIIESPYFLMSRELDLTLAQAQARGVQVVILTNSLASTDHVVTYTGYSQQKRKLLARGTEVWEYVGPHHLHAKSVLIDGSISIIGSHNLDPRSEHLDTQSAIVVRDTGVAEDLLGSMAEHFADARQVCPGLLPLGAAQRNPGAEPEEIRQFRRARLVAPLIKRSL